MSLASTLENCTIIADKGYIGVQYQKNLFETAQVERITPLRKNQKKTSKWNYYLAKTRRRIETSFSQLTDQFAIKQNLAKSFNGFWARLTTKITALTAIQLLNFNRQRPINQIKNALT